MKYIYAPAIGVVLSLNTGIILTGSTSLNIYIERKDGVSFTRAATIDPVNPMVMNYTIAAGDFDPATPIIFSDYVAVAQVAFSAAAPFSSAPDSFRVLKIGQNP